MKQKRPTKRTDEETELMKGAWMDGGKAGCQIMLDLISAQLEQLRETMGLKKADWAKRALKKCQKKSKSL